MREHGEALRPKDALQALHLPATSAWASTGERARGLVGRGDRHVASFVETDSPLAATDCA